jgi:hypothetical protein
MKMIVFRDVAPCSLVDTDRRFRDAYCLHHQGDKSQNTPDDGPLKGRNKLDLCKKKTTVL